MEREIMAVTIACELTLSLWAFPVAQANLIPPSLETPEQARSSHAFRATTHSPPLT